MSAVLRGYRSSNTPRPSALPPRGLGREKETRTILDKLRRASAYFWEPRGLAMPGRHGSQRRSYYLDAFKAGELRRPKALIITRSAKRADNIWKLAARFFGESFNEDQLADFMEKPSGEGRWACSAS